MGFCCFRDHPVQAGLYLCWAVDHAPLRRFPDDVDRTLNVLIWRELIEPADEGYSFQVELIRRWFAWQVK